MPPGYRAWSCLVMLVPASAESSYRIGWLQAAKCTHLDTLHVVHGICILTAGCGKETLRWPKIQCQKCNSTGQHPRWRSQTFSIVADGFISRKLCPDSDKLSFYSREGWHPLALRSTKMTNPIVIALLSNHQWALPKVSGFRQSWGQFSPKQRDLGLMPGLLDFASHCG